MEHFLHNKHTNSKHVRTEIAAESTVSIGTAEPVCLDIHDNFEVRRGVRIQIKAIIKMAILKVSDSVRGPSIAQQTWWKEGINVYYATLSVMRGDCICACACVLRYMNT